jgi:chemotaxis protein CheC
MNTPLPTLSPKAMAHFKSMSKEGASSATAALSALIHRPIVIQALKVAAVPLEQISQTVGDPEEKVSTVMMVVQGKSNGYILIIFPHQSALNTADLMQSRPIGTTTTLSEADNSALKESGNIVAGSFLSSFSNYLQINLLESVPDLATDMLQATIDTVLAQCLQQNKEESMAFEVDYQMCSSTKDAQTENPECKVNASFLLILSNSTATDLVNQLEKK